MKLPLALLALQTCFQTTVMATDSSILDERVFSLIENSRRNLVDSLSQEQKQASPDRQHQQRHQHQAQQQPQQQRQLQQELCSCSPTIFHLRVDFSKDCSYDSLKSNGGIAGTLCILGEASDGGGIVPTSPTAGVTMAPSTGMPAAGGMMTAPPSPFGTSTDGGDGTTTTSPAPTNGRGGMTEDPVTPMPTDGSDPFRPPSGGMPVVTTAPTVATGTEDDEESEFPTFAPSPPFPTWSPTAADDKPDDDDGIEQRRFEHDTTYAPTVAWPTYHPTPHPVDAQDGSAVTKPLTLLERAAGYTTHTHHTKSDAVVSMMERLQPKNHARNGVLTYGDELDVIATSSDNKESNDDVPLGLPTYEPTTSWPTTSYTPYPTDDGTYAPTTRAPVSHAPFTFDPTVFVPPEEAATGDMRRLITSNNVNESTSSGIGKWASIHPNDEFFAKFPEFRERQEEIYRMRAGVNNGNAADAHGNDAGFNDSLKQGKTVPPRRNRILKRKKDVVMLDDQLSNSDVDPPSSSTTSTNALIPNQLLTAQFLEMDTSDDMNIINQDDTYLNFTFPSPGRFGVTELTLEFTSISSMLDPALPLADQLGYLPGGAILILVAQTANGEIIRNRVLWTYTMGCGMEDGEVVEVGDVFSWAVFEQLGAPREEFCPASAGVTTLAPTPTTPSVPTTSNPTPSGSSTTKKPSMPTPPTKRPSTPSTSGSKPSTSSKSSKPHKPSSSSSGGSSSSTSKSSKPGLSMPSSDEGLIMDQFDLSKSAKKKSSSKTTSSKSSSKTSSTKSSSKTSSTKSSSKTSSSSKATKHSSSSSDSSSSSSDSSSSSSDSHSSSQTSHSSNSSSSKKSSKASSNSSESKKSHSSSSSRRTRRVLEGEEETKVFGRRILSKHDRESTTATVLKPRRAVEFGRSLERRLRKRNVL